MRARLVAGLITGIAVAGTAGPALALQSMDCATSKEAANDCKLRGCETNLAKQSRGVRRIASKQVVPGDGEGAKHQCDQYCDDYAAKQVAAKAGCAEK